MEPETAILDTVVPFTTISGATWGLKKTQNYEKARQAAVWCVSTWLFVWESIIMHQQIFDNPSLHETFDRITPAL